jgi:hypothetical protein
MQMEDAFTALKQDSADVASSTAPAQPGATYDCAIKPPPLTAETYRAERERFIAECKVISLIDLSRNWDWDHPDWATTSGSDCGHLHKAIAALDARWQQQSTPAVTDSPDVRQEVGTEIHSQKGTRLYRKGLSAGRAALLKELRENVEPLVHIVCTGTTPYYSDQAAKMLRDYSARLLKGAADGTD